MEKIVFEDATLTSQAKVTIDGVDHLVTEAEYSGGTDLNAKTFNNMQDNIEKAIDGVVESGSNENGSWTKWEDGTMICTKKVDLENVVFNRAWGALYEHENALDLGNFAQPFIDIPEGITATCVSATVALIQNVKGTTNSHAGEVWLCRPNAYTSTKITISITAKGKWK